MCNYIEKELNYHLSVCCVAIRHEDDTVVVPSLALKFREGIGFKKAFRRAAHFLFAFERKEDYSEIDIHKQSTCYPKFRLHTKN